MFASETAIRKGGIFIGTQGGSYGDEPGIGAKATELGVEAGLLAKALAMIGNEGVSLVVIKNGRIIHSSGGRGIAPLLGLYNTDLEMMNGACVCDLVIGKAAAMIIAEGQAAAANGEIMSEAAFAFLAERGIKTQYSTLVAAIEGREPGTMCPIEASVLDIADPAEGVAAILRRLEQLRGGGKN